MISAATTLLRVSAALWATPEATPEARPAVKLPRMGLAHDACTMWDLKVRDAGRASNQPCDEHSERGAITLCYAFPGSAAMCTACKARRCQENTTQPSTLLHLEGDEQQQPCELLPAGYPWQAPFPPALAELSHKVQLVLYRSVSSMLETTCCWKFCKVPARGCCFRRNRREHSDVANTGIIAYKHTYSAQTNYSGVLFSVLFRQTPGRAGEVEPTCVCGWELVGVCTKLNLGWIYMFALFMHHAESGRARGYISVMLNFCHA